MHKGTTKSSKGDFRMYHKFANEKHRPHLKGNLKAFSLKRAIKFNSSEGSIASHQMENTEGNGIMTPP